MDFPDPDDLLNFKVEMQPDEVSINHLAFVSLKLFSCKNNTFDKPHL